MKIKNKLKAGIAATSIMLLSNNALSLDIDPGDYTPLPSGVNLGVLYLQNSERTKLYSNKEVISTNANLKANVSILRGVHYTEFGGKMANIQILLPFASLKTRKDLSALGNSKGMGDPILASALWFNKNPTDANLYGITQYLFVPIGKYSPDRALNIGENRWKYTLQAGYIGKISEKILFDLTGDVTIFGKNSKFSPDRLNLKQDNLYQAQSYLRYKPSASSEIHIGYSKLWSGETTVNNIKQNDQSNQQKIMIGGSKFISDRTQILANISRDTKIDNGLKEDHRFNLRLLHVF
ncbi:transporter [Nitrincola tapanii]|nr:transporter [Nitrincola tapanii]